MCVCVYVCMYVCMYVCILPAFRSRSVSTRRMLPVHNTVRLSVWEAASRYSISSLRSRTVYHCSKGRLNTVLQHEMGDPVAVGTYIMESQNAQH